MSFLLWPFFFGIRYKVKPWACGLMECQPDTFRVARRESMTWNSSVRTYHCTTHQIIFTNDLRSLSVSRILKHVSVFWINFEDSHVDWFAASFVQGRPSLCCRTSSRDPWGSTIGCRKWGSWSCLFLLLETLADIILKVKMGYLQAKPRRCPKSSHLR